jgi:hypothetical protein
MKTRVWRNEICFYMAGTDRKAFTFRVQQIHPKFLYQPGNVRGDFWIIIQQAPVMTRE